MNEGKDRTKRVYVICHGLPVETPGWGRCLRPNSWLSPRGVNQMQGVVDRNPCMRDCSVFATGPLPIMGLSLAAMMRHLGLPSRDLYGIHYVPEFWPKNINVWYPENAAPEDITPLAAYRRSAEAVTDDGSRLVERCRELARRVKPGGAVLCSTCCGLLDAAAILAKLRLGKGGHIDAGFRAWQHPFCCAEGVVFAFDEEGRLVDMEEIRG